MTRLCCLSKISTLLLLFSITFVSTAFAGAPGPPEVTFTASQEAIVMGDTSTLSWTSVGESGATIATTINNVEVTPGEGGSMIYSPTSTTPYELSSTATNGWGTSTATTTSVTVNVQYSITATSGSNGSISPSGTTIVNSGTNQTYTFTPDTGYRVADVAVDGSSQGATNTYTFSGISANHSISVSFELITYTISASSGPNGSVSPSGNSIVSDGGNLSIAITPNPGYHVLDVLVDNASVGPTENYDFTDITANHTISATFAINTYIVTATADTGGSVSLPGDNTVNYGGSLSVSILPATGYSIADVQIDNISRGPLTSYDFVNVDKNHSIHATFVINDFTITASAGTGGSISPAGISNVTHDSNLVLTITPETGYSISDIQIDGVSLTGPLNPTYEFTNVTENHSIHATFVINDFTITASAGTGGSISPVGVSSVTYGSNLSLTITPETGYSIADIQIDGVSLTGPLNPTYEFTIITDNHTIAVSFSINTFTITPSAGVNGTITSVDSGVINYGGSREFTISPEPGYSISDVQVDEQSVGVVSSYTFTNVIDNHTISATFAETQYTITASAGTGGSISPAGISTVAENSDLRITISPDTGYSISDIQVDGDSLPGPFNPTYDFTNISGDHTISASFSINTYTITPSAGANGSITSVDSGVINYGGSREFTISPEPGYSIADVQVDEQSVGVVSTYTFTNVINNHTISANFAEIQYTITASAGTGGSISPAGVSNVIQGSNLTMTITPDTGYSIADIQIDGASLPGPLNPTYDFTNISGDHTITVSFSINTYTITPFAGANGSITSVDSGVIDYGGSREFTISPEPGYNIADVQVDGQSIGIVSSYEFTNVISDHSISATFSPEVTNYTITTSAGAGGSVFPSGAISVGSGTDLTVTMNPDPGYIVDYILVDGGTIQDVSTYTFSSIASDHTLSVVFEFTGSVVTATAGDNGNISPAGVTNVNSGDDLTYTITPNAGYRVSNVTIDSVTNAGSVTSYTFRNITANHTINADFEIITHTITASAGVGGSVNPNGEITVNNGDTPTISISPDAGYSIGDVLVDGVSVTAVPSYQFPAVITDHTIYASFVIDTLTITATAGSNGSISPDGESNVNYGSSFTVDIIPNAGFSIADVLVDNESVGVRASYTFTDIKTNHSITASFDVSSYTITTTSGLNGLVNPEGVIPISHGSSLNVNIEPETGYSIAEVLVDSVPIEPVVASYQFDNVSQNHELHANFEFTGAIITATAGPNGAISDTGETIVNSGDSLTYTFTPNTGYSVSEILIDGVSGPPAPSYTFSDITSNHTIVVNFVESTYTITTTSDGNGTFAPPGVISVAYGDNLTVSINPNTGYDISGVFVDDVPVVPVPISYDFINITQDHTLSATFEYTGATITATAGANGSISRPGTTIYNSGDEFEYEITPDTGYSISSVLVDGVPVTPTPNSYMFTNITIDHTIEASFEINSYTIDATVEGNGSVSPPGSTTVNYGDALTIEITPDTGYYISDVLVNGQSIGAVDSYTFADIDADNTIIARFSMITYTINATSGLNGSLSPEGEISINYGNGLSVSIIPDAGFIVEDVLVDGFSVGAVNSYTFTNVLSDHTISASFSIAVYTIEASAGDGGSISPIGATFVNHGSDLTVSITPDAAYNVADILVDGVSVGADTSYIFTNVSTNHTIEAIFQFNGARIRTSAGVGGTVSPNGETIVNFGDTLEISITPNPGYIIGNVIVDGTSEGAIDSYTFSNINEDHTLSVTFAFIGSKIVATAGENGTISPGGTTTVNNGDNLTFTITPDPFYGIVDVQVDGESVGPVSSHTFSDIQKDHSINAQFEFIGATVNASAGANGTISPVGTTIVNMGDTLTYTITPATGYSVDVLLIDGSPVLPVDSYTFSNIDTNHSINVTFIFTGFIVTATSDTNGSVSPAGDTIVNSGGSMTYTIIPDAGYSVADVTVNGLSVGSGTTHTITNITENKAIHAQFTFSGLTIEATAGPNGTVEPNGVTNVNAGDTLTVNIQPDSGYIISDVIVDSESVGVVDSYTFTTIAEDHTMNVIFEASGFTITSTADTGGAVSPLGITLVSSGSNMTVSITPDSGYIISDVLIDGVSVGAVESYIFTNISSNHTLSAVFTFVGATITTSAGAGGVVSPDGPTHVYQGDDLIVTITPDATYRITDVLVDSASVGMVTSYTFTNITEDHTLEAVFEIIPLYTISGMVTSSGTGLPDVTITLSGDAEMTTITDGSGNYYFSDIEQGVYTLTPSITGYAFSPLYATIEVVDQDLTNIDFQALPPWAGIKQFGSSLEDDGWTCHEDIYGNVYVAGKTLGGVGGHSNKGSYDVYVKKYNASGVTQWTVQIGSTGDNPSDYVYGITTDSVNNVYVLGQTTGLMGSSSFGKYDIFILKYSNDGALLWKKQAGSDLDDYARSIAADSDNNIYITGYTYGDLTGPGKDFDRDAYLMKYDSSGNHIWTDQQGTHMDDEGSGVAVSHTGDIYVTGYTEGALAGIENEGHRDIFLSKYDSTGSIQWTELLSSVEKETATAVTVSASGDIYIGAYTLGSIDSSNIGAADYLIAKYNSEGLNQWVRQGGSIENDMVMSISSFGTDDIYIGGYTEGDLGGSTSAGLKDAFIVKYNSNGDEQWVRMAGTLLDDFGCTLSSKAPDSVFISGYTKGHFDGGDIDSAEDAFLIKFNSSGEIQGELNILETVDGNDDGVFDISQPNVESFQSYDDQDIITIETSVGTILSSTEATAIPQSVTPPVNTEFPYGVFTFNIEDVGVGESTTATLYLPEGDEPDTYYKYGKTPDDDTPHWYEFSYDGTTGAQINGNIITLYFVDGRRGDNDLEENGVIEDPGAPGAIKTSTPATPNEDGNESGDAESGGGGGGGGCFIGSLL